MRQTVLIGLFALCMAGCATDDSKYVQVPAPPTERAAPATPSAAANAPSSPSDAAPEKKQTPDGQPKSASTKPKEPTTVVPSVRPRPIKKDTPPTTKTPPKIPSSAVTVPAVSPKKTTDSGNEIPTLTLVHGANLQGEIEPCG